LRYGEIVTPNEPLPFGWIKAASNLDASCKNIVIVLIPDFSIPFASEILKSTCLIVAFVRYRSDVFPSMDRVNRIILR
jgi:hypothetical protein